LIGDKEQGDGYEFCQLLHGAAGTLAVIMGIIPGLMFTVDQFSWRPGDQV
jgi:hypothetical protein